MKEYSRYLKSIGEKESPISTKTFNFFGVDVSLECLDESMYKSVQTSGITDSILEDVIRITLRQLWKSEYINARDVEVLRLLYNESADTYYLECVGVTSMCSYDKVKIIAENIDISSKQKPIIKIEEYKPMITIVEDKVVPLDSFSKFYDFIGGDNV